MTDHPTLDALADAAEDLLSPEQSGAVEAHLATCADCQAQAASLRAVTAELGAVNSTQLGKQASALPQAADMDPHRFSRAWQCARQVTEGRIVGLANSRVDGQPALLVYLRSDQSTKVVVVTGCASAAPSVGPSALLSR